MSESTPGSVFRIRVRLREVEPPVWRRIEVPAGITLDELHDVLQIVMGWTDSHLHEYRIGRRVYAIPEFEQPDEVTDERGVRLDEIAGPGDTLVYSYDFGDGWVHDLDIEQRLPADPAEFYPCCLAGARACPPEDCGGPPGYAELLRIIADPQHEEYESMCEWLGEEFDPEAFDPDLVNAVLSAPGDPGWDDDDLLADEFDDEPGADAEFTDADAARLRAFLEAPARPEDTLRYESLAGFLFAIACSPEIILPSEWIPLVFDDRDANLGTEAEAREAFAAMIALYNWIAYGVRAGTPALPPGIEVRTPALANFDEDAPLGRWAVGFTVGSGYLDELWDAYLPEALDEDFGSCLTALSYFSSRERAETLHDSIEGDRPTPELIAANIAGIVPAAMQSFAQIAWSIQTVVREAAEQPLPARSEKVGRNEPCPCGSGKKYKKCCGLKVH